MSGTLCYKSSCVTTIFPPVIIGIRCVPGIYLPYTLRFSGKGGFIYTQIVAFDYNSVSRDLYTLINQHKISRHKVGACNDLFLATTNHFDVRGG